MLNWIFPFLVSPDNGLQLEYNEAENCLTEPVHLFTYQIIENVPVLLQKDAILQHLESEKHEKLNTTFNYVEHYQKDAKVFDYSEEIACEATFYEIKRLQQSILKSIPKSCKLLLDVGCGSGWIAKHFQSTDLQIVSMDISIENTKKVMAKYPAQNHAAILADVYHLPFFKNSFDCIIASEIIEHVAHPETFIQKLLEVLKPGGSLIITTPYKEKIEMNLCIHCNHPTPKNAHLHSFDELKLSNMVRKQNIKTLSWFTFNNKYATKLRGHLITQFFPYGLWRIFDKIINRILNKPTRILLKITK